VAQAGFGNPIIERSANNGWTANDLAKYAYPATMRHGTVRFRGLWPRAVFETASPYERPRR
jgi:hypothetical protein